MVAMAATGHCLTDPKQRAKQTKLTIAAVIHSRDLATAMTGTIKAAGGKNAVITPSKSEVAIAPNTMRSPTKGDLHVIHVEMKMQNNGPMISMRSYGDTAGGFVILSHDSAALAKTGDTATNNKITPTTVVAARF